ncbi:enoyl-CoA hydratase/isomerase family protein [Bradyrhizobium sp.]|uniref:enoyl-CoA hydratase/isomerase family protein n=1 Tax=Bradyrhizobium sp. TaxID=376 RepID=UPI0039E24BB8
MTVESIVKRDGAVVEIVIDRPRVHNALDAATLDALQAAFDGAQRSGARVIVLKGMGRSFSSGADRRAYPGYSGESRGQGATQADITIGNRVCRAIAQCNAITIARLQGHVLGGGLALALACDIRLAANDAVMGLPEVELSVPLGWGALYRLAAIVGRTQAMELLLTPKRLSGAEAAGTGLANAAVESEQLDACIDERVSYLTGLDPNALLLTKLQFRALAAASTIGDIEAFDGQLLLSALRSGAYDRFAANR